MSTNESNQSSLDQPTMLQANERALGYVPRYGPCNVCGVDFENRDELVETTVPLFAFSNHLRIEDWNRSILQCRSCLEKFGTPLKAFHRPYDLDVALFANTKEYIVLSS